MKIPYSCAFFIALFLLVTIINGSCKKSSSSTTAVVTVPILTTDDLIINLTSTTAQSGGVITYEGGGTLTANGVCYSTSNKTPTTGDSKTTDSLDNSGTSTISFTSKLSSLTPNTLYYLRAYATNSAGTAYGGVISFTTSTNLTALTATVTTLVGNGTAGASNGSGVSALFNNPQGITNDGKGNLLVADTYNSLIRQIDASANVITFSGNGTIGYTDGASANAQYYAPKGLATDGQGNTYVADFGNNVIRKITATGVVSTFAGTGLAGFVDGSATVAQFSNPSGICIDASGNLYVTDHGNNVIRKITSAGVVSTFAGVKTAGYVNATGTAAAFRTPNGIAIDASGNLYVADQGNSAIRKITPAAVVTTLAGGPSQISLINIPTSVAVDKSGNVYIADEGGRVLECTTASVLYILAGKSNVSGYVDGTGTAALFSSPEGITVDANGILYVADQGNNCVRKITVAVTQ